jgi:hypothetical protein
MSSDDEAARKARAKRLRKQIRQMSEAEADADEPAAAETEKDEEAAGTESPRDFIHRKMRERDKKE